MAVIAGVSIALLAVAVLVAVLTDEPPQLTGETLVHSVEDETGSAAFDGDRCRRRGGERWTCEVTDRAGSGGATYAVEMTSDHCWRARLTESAGEPMPRTASGCLR